MKLYSTLIWNESPELLELVGKLRDFSIEELALVVTESLYIVSVRCMTEPEDIAMDVVDILKKHGATLENLLETDVENDE